MINLPVDLTESWTPTVKQTWKNNKLVLLISDLTNFIDRTNTDLGDYEELSNRVLYIRGLLEFQEVINQLSGLEKCVLVCLSFFASIEKALGIDTDNNHGFKAYDNRITAYLQRIQRNHTIENEIEDEIEDEDENENEIEDEIEYNNNLTAYLQRMQENQG